jgi:hypothetical protein
MASGTASGSEVSRPALRRDVKVRPLPDAHQPPSRGGLSSVQRKFPPTVGGRHAHSARPSDDPRQHARAWRPLARRGRASCATTRPSCRLTNGATAYWSPRSGRCAPGAGSSAADPRPNWRQMGASGNWRTGAGVPTWGFGRALARGARSYGTRARKGGVAQIPPQADQDQGPRRRWRVNLPRFADVQFLTRFWWHIK